MTNKKEAEAAASYIVTFFNDVENLSFQSGSYLNLIIKCKAKYPKKDLVDDITSIDEEDQLSLVNITQNLRMAAFRTYTKVMAMKDQLKLSSDKVDELQKLYKRISEAISPGFNDVEEYNIKLNSLFIDGVGANLLLSSQDIISGLSA